MWSRPDPAAIGFADDETVIARGMISSRRLLKELPPGPRAPAVWQTLATGLRPADYLARCRARYGPRFTIRPLGQPPYVVFTKPDDVKELFSLPADVVHPGAGARILEPALGSHSVIILDEDAHLEQRRLLLSALHGEHVQRLSGLMNDLIEREVASWPRERPIALQGPLNDLALEVILRTVFGLVRGEHSDQLRELLAEIMKFANNPLSLMPLPQDGRFAKLGAVAHWHKSIASADQRLFELIRARQVGDRGEDILAMLLEARHLDGSPMSTAEVRDELMTMLVAGHETTASQLAWAFERLSREPAVVARVQEEIDAGVSDDYLTATIQEIQRQRPVLPFATPRLVVQEAEIGGVSYPPGVSLIASPYLLHHDPEVYPNPHAFRPERFLEQPPRTYTWIPFGGGRRRCIGPGFATQEMKLVLRAVLGRCDLAPERKSPEVIRLRSIVLRPARGARVVLSPRVGGAGKPAPGLAAMPVR